MVIALAIVSMLLFISETMPFSDSIKSNGIFQALVSVLKSIKEALSQKKP